MIGRVYQTLQHLSIDIAIGAVILLHFFSKIFQTQVGWAAYVLLGLSIWIIYTVDHLRDAKHAKVALRSRYLFHAQHERFLKRCVITAILVASGCLFFLKSPILIGGLILASFGSIYLFLQHRLAKMGVKEAYIAIIYSAGILMPHVVISQSLDAYWLVMLMLIAFTNLVVFSWFEREEDLQDEFNSIATKLDNSTLEKILMILLSVGTGISILGMGQMIVESTIFLVMYIGLIVLILRPKWAKQHARYRIIGDGIFLLPIAIELF